jgi:hypothetical protein
MESQMRRSFYENFPGGPAIKPRARQQYRALRTNKHVSPLKVKGKNSVFSV